MSDDFSTVRAAVINTLIEKGVFIAAGKSCRSCMSERFSIWELATALAFFLCHYSNILGRKFFYRKFSMSLAMSHVLLGCLVRVNLPSPRWDEKMSRFICVFIWMSTSDVHFDMKSLNESFSNWNWSIFGRSFSAMLVEHKQVLYFFMFQNILGVT